MTDLTRPELGRREWHRVLIDMPAVLSSGKEKLPGRIVDISVGGALFESGRKWFRFPGPCLLRLPIRTASADHTTIPAEVVRTAGGRFGLRWAQRIPAHALIKLALPLDR
jgi:hypothetical protein